MRHGRKKYKVGTNPSHRKEIVRGLCNAVIEHGKIKTTITKCRAVRGYVEKPGALSGGAVETKCVLLSLLKWLLRLFHVKHEDGDGTKQTKEKHITAKAGIVATVL